MDIASVIIYPILKIMKKEAGMIYFVYLCLFGAKNKGVSKELVRLLLLVVLTFGKIKRGCPLTSSEWRHMMKNKIPS